MPWSSQASSSHSIPDIPPPNYLDAVYGEIHISRPESNASTYSSVTLPSPCRCELQQPDFCPYCDFEQSQSAEALMSPGMSSRSSPVEFSSSTLSEYLAMTRQPTSRPRKLRKSRHHRNDPQDRLRMTHSVSAPTVFCSDTSASITLVSPSLDAEEIGTENGAQNSSELEEDKNVRKRTITITEASSRSSRGSRGGPKVIRSKSFATPKSPNSIGPRPQPISSSIETDALVALAWTGEVSPEVRLSQLSLEPPQNRHSPIHSPEPQSASTTPEILEPTKRRPALLKKASRPQSVAAKRSWTLAMVITDDGITDEKLVDDLETMRIKEMRDDPSGDTYPLGLGPPPLSVYKTELYATYAEYPPEAEEIGPEVPLSPSDASWNSARRVLLLCRELVRTERRYLSSLKTLITNGTSTPPPARMLPYLPGLIEASEKVLALMEENPSVEGVSKALLSCEECLKDAYTSWCEVVGEFFFADSATNVKVTVEDVVDVSAPSGSPGVLSRPRSTTTSLRTQSAESGLSVVIPEPNKIRRNVRARPLVRDLAILPTQRIARYVLMFKELHSLTPPELPSSAIVTSALQVAESIAASANEAQGHAAFQTPPSKSFVPSEAMNNPSTSSFHN